MPRIQDLPETKNASWSFSDDDNHLCQRDILKALLASSNRLAGGVVDVSGNINSYQNVLNDSVAVPFVTSPEVKNLSLNYSQDPERDDARKLLIAIEVANSLSLSELQQLSQYSAYDLQRYFTDPSTVRTADRAGLTNSNGMVLPDGTVNIAQMDFAAIHDAFQIAYHIKGNSADLSLETQKVRGTIASLPESDTETTMTTTLVNEYNILTKKWELKQKIGWTTSDNEATLSLADVKSVVKNDIAGGKSIAADSSISDAELTKLASFSKSDWENFFTDCNSYDVSASTVYDKVKAAVQERQQKK